MKKFVSALAMLLSGVMVGYSIGLNRTSHLPSNLGLQPENFVRAEALNKISSAVEKQSSDNASHLDKSQNQEQSPVHMLCSDYDTEEKERLYNFEKTISQKLGASTDAIDSDLRLYLTSAYGSRSSYSQKLKSYNIEDLKKSYNKVLSALDVAEDHELRLRVLDTCLGVIDSQDWCINVARDFFKKMEKLPSSSNYPRDYHELHMIYSGHFVYCGDSTKCLDSTYQSFTHIIPKTPTQAARLYYEYQRMREYAVAQSESE